MECIKRKGGQQCHSLKYCFKKLFGLRINYKREQKECQDENCTL